MQLCLFLGRQASECGEMSKLVLYWVAVRWGEERSEASAHRLRFRENVQVGHGKTLLSLFEQELFHLLADFVVLRGQRFTPGPKKQAVPVVGSNDSLG